jgi:lipopolysaccharide export system protein LptA
MPTRFNVSIRRGNAQRVGLLIAAVLAVAFAVIIGILMTRARPAASTPTDTSVPDVAPPDIKDMPGGGRSAANQLMGSGGLFVQLMDRKDPTRLAGELQSQTIDPIENRRYHVGRPQIWIYFKDGRVLLVQSDEGRLYMPDRSREPEAGTLEGKVVMRLFAPPPKDRRVDPEKDAPLLTATMNRLDFDNSLGEVTTPDLVLVTSPRVDFQGRGLRLVYNEPKQRIESLDVRTEGKLVIRDAAPRDEAPQASGTPADTAAPTSTIAAADAGSAANQVDTPSPPARPRVPEGAFEVFYHAIFAGDVDVTWRKAKLKSDQLSVFARTVDNALIPGAVAGTFSRGIDAGRQISMSVPASPMGLSLPLATGIAAMGLDQPTSPTGEVLMTWTGPLTMRPIDTLPPELQRDEVLARFESNSSNARVTFNDAQSGLEGDSGTIAYGTTTRELHLVSPAEEPASLALGRDGTLAAADIRFNLGNGVGRVQGPGRLFGADRKGDQDGALMQRATWEESADFAFRTDERGTTSEIQTALLAGKVLLADARSSMNAGFVRAEFNPARNSRDQSAPVLARLVASEGVEASDGKGGSLKSGRLDVAFEPAPDARTPRPVRMLASDQVRTNQGTSTLFSDALDATFRADPDDARRAQAHVINARGNVRYEGTDGVFATAELLEADAIAQNATLMGKAVVVGKDQTRITSSRVKLDQLARTMVVDGAGELSHVQEGYAAPIVASWTKSMTFNDTTGVIDCVGETKALARPDDATTDTLAAEQLRIELTPASEDAKQSGKPARVLVRATATESSDAAATGNASALAESLSYTPGAPQNKETLERVRSLKAPTITLEAERQLLVVPTAGRLYLQDVRPEGETLPPGAAEPASADRTRGYALFEWKGSMQLDRSTGSAQMLDRVRVTQRAPTDQHALYLECDKLLASGTAPARDSSVDGASGRGEVRSVVAQGNVYAKSQDRELAADRAEYLAQTRTLVASGDNGNSITLFDPKTATPVTARELAWELDTGRIEIRRPGPIVAPR